MSTGSGVSQTTSLIAKRIEELGIYNGGIITDRDAELLCEGTFLGWSVSQYLSSSTSPSTPAVARLQFNSDFPQHSCRCPTLHLSRGCLT